MIDKEELIREEKKFLHDISNHLLVAQGMSSFIERVVKDQFEEDSKEVQRSEKLKKAIDNIIDLVRDQRERIQDLSSD